jgi:uncharacterized protein
MSLETIINEQMKAAMKSGEKLRLETIRSIRAVIIEFSKSGTGKEMTPDEEINILNSLAKKRKDAIEMYANAGRTDLKEKEEEELKIIMEFLPKQMSADEMRDVIREIISENGFDKASDLGKLIGASVKQLKGKGDNKLIQQIAKELLGA